MLRSGDLNIVFLKHSKHSLTSECLDILYSHSFFPVITKPTRITKNSATLIDHIFTNNINMDSDHVQGILCCSISDHYGIFHVTCASCVNADEENPIMKRDHILRSAERQYYYERLCEYKSNLGKYWQVIKFIINKRKSRPANSSFVCNRNTIDDGKRYLKNSTFFL